MEKARINIMGTFYLDNAATTKLPSSMKAYLAALLDLFGNPSSMHSEGEKAKKIIDNSRKQVAKFINANTNEIYFTGSGSASNTLAARGYCSKHNCTVLYSPISHKSILECVKGYNNSYPLRVDSDGYIDIADLKRWFGTRNIKPFVIIDYANSEIGTIQNVKKIIDLVHSYNGVVYLDCTGSISSIPLDVKEIDADMAGFSAHKIGGLKGCGVLFKKREVVLEPLVYGSQEKGLVGGTENVIGIASLGKAAEDYGYSSVSSSDRDSVYGYITEHIPGSYLVGAPIESGNRLPHNLCMCFKGVEGESLMLLLDMGGIQVSTGSACTSGDLTPSAALSAIGMDKQDIHSCIRMTFGGKLQGPELRYICQTLKQCVEKLRNYNRQQL